MRANIDKKHYTKPERILARLLQENQISFQSKVSVGGYEVDFLIGNYAIEINGHSQRGDKNHTLAELGYIPLHFTNTEVYSNRDLLLETIKQLHGTYKLSKRSS